MSNNPISDKPINKRNIFKEVYHMVKKIPWGKVTTYGKIANKLNISPRTVGWALHANSDKDAPCHRVVNRQGKIAKSYRFGGGKEQRRRLESEGVSFIDEIHVILKEYRWKSK